MGGLEVRVGLVAVFADDAAQVLELVVVFVQLAHLVIVDHEELAVLQGLAPVANTPEEMAKAMKEESALWARVVKERKIEVK